MKMQRAISENSVATQKLMVPHWKVVFRTWKFILKHKINYFHNKLETIILDWNQDNRYQVAQKDIFLLLSYPSGLLLC